ncbi:MAG: hypothetical protein JKX85_13485 [Phycisphaeraceae bacterium]|nr:hypothetical protein [Phycisphaeraceae bacterium]
MHQRHAPGSVAAISCSDVDRDPIQNSCKDALAARPVADFGFYLSQPPIG